MSVDNPRTRNTPVCPLCHGMKQVGALVCWHCYKAEHLRDGNPDAERMIADHEAKLRYEAAASGIPAAPGLH